MVSQLVLFTSKSYSSGIVSMNPSVFKMLATKYSVVISYPAQGWSPHRVLLASFYCCWCVIENHGIPEQLSFHPCHNFYLFSESINKTFAFYSISNIYAKWIDPTSTNVPGPDHRTTSIRGIVFANGRNITLSILTSKGWLRDALCISKIQDRMNVRIVKLYPIHPLFCHCQRPHRWNCSLPPSLPKLVIKHWLGTRHMWG